MAPKRRIDDDPDYDEFYAYATKKAKKAKTTVSSDVQGTPVASNSTPSPEKRLARFKPKCPANIADRVDRVMTQRFFMVDRERNGDDLREEFKVLGSTGNVYTVVVDKLPSCNCPDATKGNHCKHILFIFLKVLGVPSWSTHYYQKALLTSELEEIFRDAPQNPTSAASARVREVYAAATGTSSSKGKAKAEPLKTKRKEIEDDDDCPVCYEGLKGAAEAKLVFCETCSNPLHKECFEQWRRTKAGQPLTCVWCRAPWVDSLPAGASGSKALARMAKVSSEGYLNLGKAAGMDEYRDTSTYHRYGGYYDDY